MKITTPLLQPIRSFMPQTDSQAGRFIQVWCMKCANVKKLSEHLLRSDSCPILDAAKAYHDTSPHYPKQWQLDKTNQPICTGFSAKQTSSLSGVEGREQNPKNLKTARDLLNERSARRVA